MKKTILVVDDEALIVENILSTLQSTRLYDVEATTSAYDAFERASKKPYDLVISDLLMPGMNGDTLYLCLWACTQTIHKKLCLARNCF